MQIYQVKNTEWRLTITQQNGENRKICVKNWGGFLKLLGGFFGGYCAVLSEQSGTLLTAATPICLQLQLSENVASVSRGNRQLQLSLSIMTNALVCFESALSTKTLRHRNAICGHFDKQVAATSTNNRNYDADQTTPRILRYVFHCKTIRTQR